MTVFRTFSSPTGVTAGASARAARPAETAITAAAARSMQERIVILISFCGFPFRGAAPADTLYILQTLRLCYQKSPEQGPWPGRPSSGEEW